MEIRQPTASDAGEISQLHVDAFGADEGEEISALVSALFNDPSAEPLFSLVAVKEGGIIGHILFTKVTVDQSGENISAQLLTPLAVAPGQQGKGVGTRLMERGLTDLKENGVDIVFVLGHPQYYPRSGFIPAGIHGLNAPYPIPAKNADAWMVRELTPGMIGRAKGTVICADALNHAHYWRE